jgi:hypothetical protein
MKTARPLKLLRKQETRPGSFLVVHEVPVAHTVVVAAEVEDFSALKARREDEEEEEEEVEDTDMDMRMRTTMVLAHIPTASVAVIAGHHPLEALAEHLISAR